MLEKQPFPSIFAFFGLGHATEAAAAAATAQGAVWFYAKRLPNHLSLYYLPLYFDTNSRYRGALAGFRACALKTGDAVTVI